MGAPQRGRSIRVHEVRALHGVRGDRSAIFVTATGFTPDAEKFETKHKYTLQLVNGPTLLGLVRDYERQVSEAA